jgi:hypothetical protein
MNFFFKPKTVVVDLFTSDAGVFKYSKPREASQFVPEWWKKIKMPSHLDTSMKGCAGFIDLYKHGFIVPMWADLNVQMLDNEQPSFIYASGKHKATSHPYQQAGSFMFDSHTRSMKLYSPWWGRTKADIYWHMTHPMWNQNMQRNWSVPPAVLSLKHQNAMHVNALIHDSNVPREFRIEFNTPMMHLLPLTESKIELKHHLVTAEELRKIEFENAAVTFNFSYRKKLASLKEQQDGADK